MEERDRAGIQSPTSLIGGPRLQPRNTFIWTGSLLALNWLTLAFLSPNAPGDVVLIGYFLGSLYAHATLSATWLAFGPGRFVWRVPLSILWLLSLLLAIAIGLSSEAWEAIGVVGTCVLGQWLMLLVPLCATRLVLGVALRRPCEIENEDKKPMRFGIRHLLIAMFASGSILGIGRVALPLVPIANHEFMAFLFLAVAAVVITIPLIFASFIQRYALAGVISSLVFIAIATVWERPMLSALGGSGPGIDHFIAINAVMATLVLIITGIVRRNGYFLLNTRGSTS